MTNKPQRTLILLKPDAIERGIVGEIVTRFERVGAQLVGMKLINADKETAMAHYTEEIAQRLGDEVRQLAVNMITSGPIVAIVLEGIDIIEVVRKMVGATEPKSAAPGTIRGDYAHVSYGVADSSKKALFNLIHASGNADEAAAEISVWFGDNELFHHKPGYANQTIHQYFS